MQQEEGISGASLETNTNLNQGTLEVGCEKIL